MKGSSRTAGARRRTARGAAVATAVLLGGMIPGAQAASGVQEIDAELAYTCDFPQGEQPVKVRVAAKVPESSRAGQVIQPEDVTLGLTLPEATLAGLAGSGAATVSAGTRLTVDVSQEGRRARAEWIGTTAGAVPVPEAGELTLSTSGSVPYVEPGASGDLTFDTSALEVDVELKRADGTPAEPSSISLKCVLGTGREAALATVDVDDEGGEGAVGPTPSEGWPGEEERAADDGDTLEVGAKPKRSAAADAPPCAGDPKADLTMVTYVTGYANVEKLDGATRFPLACGKILQGLNQNVPDEDGSIHIYQDSTVDLEYQGKPQLPPTSGTFLTFGFMPTTAKMEMTQIPPGTAADGTRETNIHSDLHIANGASKNRTEITLNLMLRLYDVKVNGVPLAVGNNCRTSRPFTLELAGLGEYGTGGFIGYSLSEGGELTGSVTLPPFSGCGVDEDLDSIFTASLSGVPNYVKQVQGVPCAPFGNSPETPAANCTSGHEPLDVPEATR